MLIAFFIALVVAYFENHETEKRNNDQYERIIQLKTIDSTSQAQIDSLRKDNKIAILEYIVGIKNYSAHTDEMLAKYAYKVDSINEVIVKTKGGDEPFISSPINPPVAMSFQKGNDFCFYSTIANTGKIGTTVHGTMSLAIKRDNLFYKLENATELNCNLPSGGQFTTDTNRIYNYTFKPFNDHVYLIFKLYYQDKNKHKVKTNLAYVLGGAGNRWFTAFDCQKILDSVKSARDLKFFPHN